MTLALFRLHVIDQRRLDSGEPIRAIASTPGYFLRPEGEKKTKKKTQRKPSPSCSSRGGEKKTPDFTLLTTWSCLFDGGFSVCIKEGTLIKVRQGRRGGGSGAATGACLIRLLFAAAVNLMGCRRLLPSLHYWNPGEHETYLGPPL